MSDKPETREEKDARKMAELLADNFPSRLLAGLPDSLKGMPGPLDQYTQDILAGAKAGLQIQQERGGCGAEFNGKGLINNARRVCGTNGALCPDCDPG